MGRDVFETAVANPDSLAEVVTPEMEAEAETYGTAHRARLTVTGKPDTAPYPARNEVEELRGEDWDYEDYEEVRRRLPRLAALYLEDDDEE